MRLLGELIPCSDLFHYYRLSLSLLADKNPIEPVLRSFEGELLNELGFSLDFSIVFEQEADNFYYVPEQGFIPCTEKLNLPLFKKDHLQAISQLNLTEPDILRSNKLLMRHVINGLLGGKPLNSRKLFTKKS